MQSPALLRRLLRAKDLSVTEIAFATGWERLGTFGRIFRDITGRSPSALRLEARADMPQLDLVPACVLKAAQRPDLKMAVLEKRRCCRWPSCCSPGSICSGSPISNAPSTEPSGYPQEHRGDHDQTRRGIADMVGNPAQERRREYDGDDPHADAVQPFPKG